MGKEIIWPEKAIHDFDDVINYLNENWTEGEAKKFILRTELILNLISENPSMFRESKKYSFGKAFITKHNLLLYDIGKTRIELLAFWDTRHNHRKKFKSLK